MNERFFNWLRKKKQEWSNKPNARLTQTEVNEANAALQPDLEAPIVVVGKKLPNLSSKTGPLAAIVGSAAAAALFVSVPKHEGTEYKAYRDIVGIWTICQGDTNNVSPAMIETPEGCRERLERQLVIHATGVMMCTPRLKEPGRDWQRAAATSLAYNIGVGAYCKSSIDKRFDVGDWQGGCANFMLYNKARVNGTLRPVRGLTIRRQEEIDTCLRGLENNGNQIS